MWCGVVECGVVGCGVLCDVVWGVWWGMMWWDVVGYGGLWCGVVG